MKIKIILVALLLSSRIVFSQGYSFSAMAGYGRCWENDDIPFNGFIYEKYTNIFNLSLSVSHCVEYKTILPAISYSSGLYYQSFFPSKPTVSLIKLPIGFDFQFGQKFQFLFGFGIFSEYVINTRNINNYNGNYTNGVYTNFQLGLNADIGFNYRINEKYSIFIKVIGDYGLTTFYKETIPNLPHPPPNQNAPPNYEPFPLSIVR
jgi:hypothetical protein